MDIQPQYLTLTNLVANRLFRIPRYQRAYSWERKQREDMFGDIRALKNKGDAFHFMATIVGMRREIKTIVTDQFKVVEIVDGQQRITTLVILLTALQKQLDKTTRPEEKLAEELQSLLVKQDNASLILLQTNHDKSHYFANYIRTGAVPPVEVAKTLADRELLRAIDECEAFVSEWNDRIQLLRLLKNQLTFIFHELDDERAVYTVFEVLNNRGLHVSWLDRLKSMLMALAFENATGNQEEHITELHEVWGSIYEAIGLRQGLSTEALRFAGTLKSASRPSKPLSEDSAVERLVNQCGNEASKAITISNWVLCVTRAVDKFLQDTLHSRAAVTGIAHARLLITAIILRGFPKEVETELMDLWEKTSFRVFGLCDNDKRTGVGDYLRLAWDILNDPTCDASSVLQRLKSISEGKEHTIEWAIASLQDENCYDGWEEELRYLFYRYEEHLAKLKGQTFSNEQWNRIWEASASRSIEHIWPQSKGSQERILPGKKGIFVHRLGNLLLLPPDLNRNLLDKSPEEKADTYLQTGLHCAAEVADTIREHGWDEEQVRHRERRLLNWIESVWA
jgi:uncharacterized protein with ParB-like and HNH nuclease domain